MGALAPLRPAAERDERVPKPAASPAATIFGDRAGPEALRGFGRMVGLLFVAGALLPVPSTLLLEPQPPLAAYAVTLAVIVTGLVCFTLPWERASLWWLHALAATATLEVAAAVAVFDEFFSVLYLLNAVLIAYGFGRPRHVLPHVGLVSVAILAPAIYDPAGARDALQVALLLLPCVWILAGALVYLRTQIDSRERAYRHFAEQALRLSERIAGRPASPPPARSLARREPPPAPPAPRWRRPALAALAAVVAVPLGTVGLAAAGLKLPGPVADAFEAAGWELPNQRDAAPSARDAGAAEQIDDLERVAPLPRPSGQAGSRPDRRARGSRGDRAGTARDRSLAGSALPAERSGRSASGPAAGSNPLGAVPDDPARDAIDRVAGGAGKRAASLLDDALGGLGELGLPLQPEK